MTERTGAIDYRRAELWQSRLTREREHIDRYRGIGRRDSADRGVNEPEMPAGGTRRRCVIVSLVAAVRLGARGGAGVPGLERRCAIVFVVAILWAGNHER